MADSTGTILSRNFYGPYGKEFAAGEITGDDTPVGLDLYDFGARMYSPSNMRWLTMDPLCEKYYSISPYNYCAGNPVNLVDPDGRIFDTFIDVASLATGVKSFVSNVKKGKVGAAIVDGIGIVADAAALATPFVSAGAGVAIKAVRGIDKAADAAKAVRGIDKAADAAKAINKADNVADAAKGASHVTDMRRGVAKETQTLEKLGEKKNTKSFTVQLDDGSFKTTIPDVNNQTVIGEIKDTKKVYNTKQIQAERKVAQDSGKEFILYTGEHTHVSRNIPEDEIVHLPWLGPQ